jgi:hypothetical protein
VVADALAIPRRQHVEEPVVDPLVVVAVQSRPVAHGRHRALDRGRHVDGAVRLEDERAHGGGIVSVARASDRAR